MFQTDRPILLTNAEIFFYFSIRSAAYSYYTALSYDAHHSRRVFFTFVKVGVIWFDSLASGQSLTLFHVLHIN